LVHDKFVLEVRRELFIEALVERMVFIFLFWELDIISGEVFTLIKGGSLIGFKEVGDVASKTCTGFFWGYKVSWSSWSGSRVNK